MPELTSVHPDELLLLRYAVRELDVDETRTIEEHATFCRTCARRVEQMLALDAGLKAAFDDGAPAEEIESSELPEGDPFRRRPEYAPRHAVKSRSATLIAAFAREASDRSAALRDRVRSAVADPKALSALLGELSLSDPAVRYALLYAMQDAGREIASGPAAALRFADQVLARLRKASSSDPDGDSDVEVLVPILTLRGQAHLLAGQSSIWTSQFEQAKTHLRLAYRSFGQAGGDEISLAIVEHVEAQRRFLLERGAEALVLARRAKASFHSLGIEDLSAKADVAVATSLGKLGREEEAIPLFYAALSVFERREIWSNYVVTLSNLATVLQKVGRLDEARRGYSRALRRIPKENSGLYAAAIRHGLAEVLFIAGRYREAAGSFSQAARLTADHGVVANSLMASLFEIESWARSGDVVRARHRLEIFQTRVAQTGGLDPNVVRGIEQALAGSTPDLEMLSDLRKRAEGDVQERMRFSNTA